MLAVRPVNGSHIIEVTEYGKSMYGGWYINFYVPATNDFNGIRRDTLREICAWLGVSRTALTRDVQRWDN